MGWAFNPANAAEVAGYGFWIGIVGAIITVGGFALTLWQIAQTKSVAQAARDEAERLRASLVSYDAAQEGARALYAIGVTRKHLATGVWANVSETYEDFRRSLLAIKNKVSNLTDDQISAIDAASDYIIKLCEQIDRDAAKKTLTVNAVKTAARMRQQNQLVVELQNTIERSLLT